MSILRALASSFIKTFVPRFLNPPRVDEVTRSFSYLAAALVRVAESRAPWRRSNAQCISFSAGKVVRCLARLVTDD